MKKIMTLMLGLTMVLGMLIPYLVAGWRGLLCGGLVRVFIPHHLTWSVNSICHVVGQRPFPTRDHSANVWALAIASFGESWHNLHHADPTSARHGVLPGQLDSSGRLIWIFEKLGWVYDVRWPTPQRLARLARQS